MPLKVLNSLYYGLVCPATLVLVLLYIRTTQVIVERQRVVTSYESFFFRLFPSQTIVNILAIVCLRLIEIMRDFPQITYFSGEENLFPSVILAILVSATIGQVLDSLALAINCFVKLKLGGTKQLVLGPQTLLAIHVVYFLVTWVLLSAGIKYLTDWQSPMALSVIGPRFEWRHILLTASAITGSLVSSGFYLFSTVCCSRRTQVYCSSAPRVRISTREDAINLFMSIVVFSSQLIVAIFLVLTVLLSQEMSVVLRRFFIAISCVSSFSPLLFLLLLSADLRYRTFSCICL